MKKILLTLAAITLFCSCTKQQIYIYPEIKPIEETIIGKWIINEDEKRYITIDSINTCDSVCYVTFPKAIDSPPSVGAMQTQYKARVSGDTVTLVHQYFYPNMRLFRIKNKMYGRIIEWMKIPSQGTVLPMRKSCN